MTYVDELRYFSKPVRVYGHYWCHMWADTLEELLKFAKGINLNFQWLQNKSTLVHFDLSPSKRTEALEKGAEFMSLRTWFRIHSIVRPSKSHK